MKIVLEFTVEDFKANQNKTLAELLTKSSEKAISKTGGKKPKDVLDEEEEVDLDEEEEVDEETDEEESEIDDSMIKTAINAATKVGNTEKVRALFTKFKCKTLSGLKTEHYEKFYNALKPLTKKAK